MVAIRERIEAIPSRRGQRLSDYPQSPQFRQVGPSVDVGPTDRFGVPLGVDTLVPKAAPNAALEPRLETKQPAPPSGSRSASQTQSKGLLGATNRVLVELARIAFADISDVFDEHGAIIPFADLPPGIRPAIAEYRVRHGRKGTYTVCLRLHSKLAALTALGRHLGMFGRCFDHVTPARLLLATNTEGEG